MIRAKFNCVSMRKYRNWNTKQSEFLYEYEFSVTTGGSPENDQFFASTPSGNVKLSAIASDLFEVGKDYYLDFSEVG